MLGLAATCLFLSIFSRSPRTTGLWQDGPPRPRGTTGHPRCSRPPWCHGAAGQDWALQPGRLHGRHAPGAAPLPAQKRQGPLRLKGPPHPPPLLLILFPRCAGVVRVPRGVGVVQLRRDREGGWILPGQIHPCWCPRASRLFARLRTRSRPHPRPCSRGFWSPDSAHGAEATPAGGTVSLSPLLPRSPAPDWEGWKPGEIPALILADPSSDLRGSWTSSREDRCPVPRGIPALILGRCQPHALADPSPAPGLIPDQLPGRSRPAPGRILRRSVGPTPL